MCCQLVIISKIDAYGGIDKLNTSLKHVISTVEPFHRRRLENLLIYLNTLYELRFKTEKDFLCRKSEFKASVTIITMLLNKRDSDILLFLKNLITECLDYYSGVRLIA